jgi:hypothetical protein
MGGTGTTAREKELEAALVKEQTARIAAEKKVKEVNAEIEELSASLFQQANEMVASERKENALLRERVQQLERQAQAQEHAAASSYGEEGLRKENAKLRDRLKTLEQRDTDRKHRLERLESASKRIEKARNMLVPPR